MNYRIFAALSFMIFCISPAEAQNVAGNIKTIQSYQGHTGLLVRLSVPMSNPANCPSSAWYILPDSNSRANVEQSLLLTAYAKREWVGLQLSGCYENYPRISVVTVEAN